ncbi:diguanylate phosphodiesterase [Spirochaetia bacterium]|nr:diguanylate phosphodiesterase [Spirochaetia bacterium]
MKGLLRSSLVLALVMLALAGCSGKKESAGSVSSEYADTLRVCLEGEPSTLFPHESAPDPNITVERQIFNLLLYRTNDMRQEFIGEIAESWEQINDLTMRFHLRDDVYFSNGEKCTAEDVKFSLELGNTNSHVHYVNQLERVDVIDPLTVDVVTKQPNPVLLYHISMVRGGSIMPKKYYESVGGMDGFARAPIGTGPYVLESWKSGQSITLKARTDYKQLGDATPGATPTIIFTFNTDMSSRTLEIETGNTDVILIPDTRDLDRLAGLGFKVETSPSYQMTSVALNVQNVPDEKIRQAMAYAIDYDAVTDVVFGKKYAKVATGIVPEIMKSGYVENWNVKYDPEKAKQLVKESGHPNGITLQALVSNASERVQMAEILQNQWRQVGINVNVTTGADATIKDNFYRGTFEVFPDMNQWSHGDVCRPLHFWRYFPAFGIPEPDATKINELYDLGYETLDPVERLKVYDQMQQLILKYWAFFPICTKAWCYVTSPKVEGFFPTPMVNPMFMMVKVKK